MELPVSLALITLEMTKARLLSGIDAQRKWERDPSVTAVKQRCSGVGEAESAVGQEHNSGRHSSPSLPESGAIQRVGSGICEGEEISHNIHFCSSHVAPQPDHASVGGTALVFGTAKRAVLTQSVVTSSNRNLKSPSSVYFYFSNFRIFFHHRPTFPFTSSTLHPPWTCLDWNNNAWLWKKA